MKRYILTLLLLGCASAFGGNLTAFFSYCSFDQPSDKPYIETYLHITGGSARLVKNQNGKAQAKVEVELIIKSDSTTIVYFDKFNMLSPEVEPSDSLIPDFIDQHRVALENGNYILEMKVTDKNAVNEKSLSLKQDVKIFFSKKDVSVSDIEYLETFGPSKGPNPYSKSGYDVVPYVNNFYPKEMTSLKFYAEVYRANAVTQDILVRYFISNSDNKKILENLVGNNKYKASDVNVILAELPIGGLPSGNYNLNIEVRDRENNLIAYRQSFFQRSNQQYKIPATAELSNIDVTNTFVTLYTNQDTLQEYLKYLYPISTRLEEDIAQSQIAQNDLRSMQQYLYAFWSKRDPENPHIAWNNYLAEVEKVNASYSTRNRKGFETERGRVYLQYGPPNSIAVTEDPSAYPYEIWHYYKIIKTGQTNRRFVFYTTDRSTNDYRLLHSDALGELQDNAWELKLHSRAQRFGSDIDREKSEDIYGSRTKENFINPR